MTTTKPTFKSEWNEADFKRMKTALRHYFLFKGMQTDKGVKVCYTYQQIEEIFGLPYTSSSNYAGLWVTNSNVQSNNFPRYRYIGFAISEENEPFSILWDKDENELLVPLK